MHRFAELVRQDEREASDTLKKLAGEALTALEKYNRYEIKTDSYDHSTNLIYDLRDVLNHKRMPLREQWDTSDMAHRSGGLSVEQEPEPTAWVTDDFAITYSAEVAQRWRDKGWKVVPFYTAPPKREWVGLTDEEIHKIIDDCTPNEAELEELNDFAKAIFAVEAQLKERNT
jgi:hypothetical protein